MADITNNPRVETSVLDTHLRKVVEPIYDNNPIMGMLKKKGLILYRKDVGEHLKWPIRYKRRPITAGTGVGVTNTFAPYNTKKWAKLGWRNYVMTEVSEKFERLITQNPDTALFKIVKDIIKESAEDFIYQFPLEFYNDGGAAGNDGVHGLESMFGTSGALSTGYVGDPSDLYANIYTALGYYGGSWTAPNDKGWPIPSNDTCSKQYCFWSPMVIDVTDTAWSNATKTWAANWGQQLRFAQTYMKTIQDVQLDVYLLHPEMEREAKDSLENDQTFEITQNSDLTKLGWITLQHEGTELLSGFGVPAGTGYGLSWKNIELRSLQKQLVATETQKEIIHLTERILLDFYGNFKFNTPANFVKFVSVTT